MKNLKKKQMTKKQLQAQVDELQEKLHTMQIYVIILIELLVCVVVLF